MTGTQRHCSLLNLLVHFGCNQRNNNKMCSNCRSMITNISHGSRHRSMCMFRLYWSTATCQRHNTIMPSAHRVRTNRICVTALAAVVLSPSVGRSGRANSQGVRHSAEHCLDLDSLERFNMAGGRPISGVSETESSVVPISPRKHLYIRHSGFSLKGFARDLA